MKSGPKNLLGQVKFMFRNTHLVYLHDTPKKMGFKFSVRLRSHGCVRVGRAFELARSLLGHDRRRPWTEKKWDELLAESEGKWMRLRRPVDLHITYWTADVSPSGRARFFRDFYRYDKADTQRIEEMMAQTLPSALMSKTTMPGGPGLWASPQFPPKLGCFSPRH